MDGFDNPHFDTAPYTDKPDPPVFANRCTRVTTPDGISVWQFFWDAPDGASTMVANVAVGPDLTGDITGQTPSPSP